VRDRGIAADLFHTGLCLPSGSGMTDDDQARVVDGITGVPRRAPRMPAGRLAERMARV
jgi:dTDP-4-amino-4,6-dideoxygalactose transaminase